MSKFNALQIGLSLFGMGDAGVAFVGAYDAITNLVHVYEPARRTLTAYTGNLVRLRRGSDNAESDFGADANGNLNTAAIAAWLGGSTGFVVTVYDQKGGDNITQATAGNQPQYVASAQNGRAGMLFNGTSTYLQGAFTNGGLMTQPIHIAGVGQLDVSVINNGTNRTLCDGDDGVNRGVLVTQGTAPTPDDWEATLGATLISNVATDSNWNLFALFGNGASSSLRKNGAEIKAGNAGPRAPDGLTVGTFNGLAGQYWKGYITAVILADPSLSDISILESALNAYWDIY